MKVHLEG